MVLTKKDLDSQLYKDIVKEYNDFKPKFIRFLKERGLFDAYKQDIVWTKNIEDLDSYIINDIYQRAVNYSECKIKYLVTSIIDATIWWDDAVYCHWSKVNTEVRKLFG